MTRAGSLAERRPSLLRLGTQYHLEQRLHLLQGVRHRRPPWRGHPGRHHPNTLHCAYCPTCSLTGFLVILSASAHDRHHRSYRQGATGRVPDRGTSPSPPAAASGDEGPHSRVLVGSLNAVEEVPVFRVCAVHDGILRTQRPC